MPVSPTSSPSSGSGGGSGSRARPLSRPGSAVAVAVSPTLSAPSSTTAASSLLYAQPASVHFGGFSLDASSSTSTSTQRVCIHNRSAKPMRLQYTLPSGGAFRARFATDRAPFLSPGLCDELLVTFTPHAFQYYYDCVRIKCEEVAYASNAASARHGTLLVPLHAYPVVNTVRFPTRMDFGAVPLGTTARRHVDLSCSVPIDFEFELRVVKPHAAFTVFPLCGTIPAHGTARIEFEFKPLLYATASADVELHVSQLGFAPLPCALTGSSASDVTDGTAGATSPTKQARPRTADQSAFGTRSTTSPHAQPKGSPKRSSSSPTQQSHQSKRRGERDETAAEIVDGVAIPADLTTMTSVNFVLTQQSGKRKPKDVKRAIDANRALRTQQLEQQEQSKHAASDGSDGSRSPAVLSFHVLVRDAAAAIDRTRVDRATREMAFLHELSEIEVVEKQLEFQSHKVRLGDELLTPEQLEVLRHMRELNTNELARRERETLRHDFTTRAWHGQTPPTPDVPCPPRCALPAQFVPAPALRPDFKSYKNDLWDRRKRVVQRLVRAISTVVVRLRAQARLEKIRHWLGSATTRAHVREKVARDWQQVAQGRLTTLTTTVSATTSTDAPLRASSTTTTTTTTTTAAGTTARLYLPGFPIVEEKETRPRAARAVPPNAWPLERDPFAFFAVRERDDALITGHEPLELPPLATYVPLEQTRALRRGALDECSSSNNTSTRSGGDTPNDHVLPVQDLRFPSMLELLPRDVFLRPSAALRPLVRVHTMRETLPTFPLRPQRVFRSTPRHWGLVLDTGVGTRSLRSLRTGLLRVSEQYQPRTERVRGTPLLLTLGGASANADELYRSVWDASDGVVPPLSAQADDVPCLSDSESDDEGEADETKTPRASTPDDRGRRSRGLGPTWRDAVRLWEEEEEDADANDDDGVAYEPGELLGKAQGVTCFERYRHSIQSERAYNAYRDELLQQLPTLLTTVASKIHHPDYELVVEGHGPSRPLHEPFSSVFRRATNASLPHHRTTT